MSESKIDTRLWSSKARNLSPYIPGEQPQHDNLCKLNTNENPFPPSPKVGQAIAKVLEQQADELRLYPAPESNDLRAALAQSYNLDINQVFVGNGSDEVLALVFASFLSLALAHVVVAWRYEISWREKALWASARKWAKRLNGEGGRETLTRGQGSSEGQHQSASQDQC